MASRHSYEVFGVITQHQKKELQRGLELCSVAQRVETRSSKVGKYYEEEDFDTMWKKKKLYGQSCPKMELTILQAGDLLETAPPKAGPDNSFGDVTPTWNSWLGHL